ncbi:endonuclease-reverse transcriptase [Plakobranchus ocellatus]|uniref:Endonuclease-reverse transcriptase n=1 Tax=Plakobranchus ocellatus TaxID=259542 RepID=A0AAV4DDJ4_9GAST|nr:endonuclease-reverse transcriptase [Plakobranchus ocellatus]
MGLFLNVKKTECMVISNKSSNSMSNLVSKGEQIKEVTKFKYLGYLITPDGRCTSEISKRIAMAKETFPKMKPILANINLSVKNKISVITVLLCGSKCWTLTRKQRKTRSSGDVVYQRNDDDIIDTKKFQCSGTERG